MRASHRGPLNGTTLFVYPTALKAANVLREQARTAGARLGQRVTTFPQLTEALARDLGVSARLLPPELSAVVLAHALERPDIPARLREPRRGLRRELLAALAELQAAFLEPADVAALTAALPPGPDAERLGELARVYAAYEAALDRLGAVDRHGRERRVCEGLAEAEAAGRRPASLRGVQRLVFAEIYDFSVLQFLIATALVRLVGDAELVAFAHPENVDATRFLDRTWNRFVGDPAIADQVLPSFAVRGGRRGSLAAALRGVFAAERPEAAPRDASIAYVIAPSRYGEVEAAVRSVRRRLERGEPAERIAILARDLALYGDLIEDVCRRYRVPVYFGRGRPILAGGVAKAVINLLRCAAEGFPQRRLAAVLESDYLRAGGRRLARLLAATGFVAEAARPLADCLAHRAARLEARAQDAAAPPERRAAAASARAALGADGERLLALVAALRPLARRRTVAGHVAALRRALGRLGFRPIGSIALSPAAVRRDAAAWARIDVTLAGLAGLGRALGSAPVPPGVFVGMLLAALEGQEIEDPAEPAGSVHALGVLEARGLDFDAVHLLGLDDGTFPAPRSESALFPDALKRQVNPHAAALLRRKLGRRAEGLPLGGLLRTARETSLEDPFLFFLALSMAEREIVLSHPAVDERGTPTVPSPFLDEVAACLAGGLPPTVVSPTAVVPAPADCCEPAELVARAALDRWGRPPSRLWPALRTALPGGAERLASIDRRARIEDRRSRYFLAPAGDAATKEALADAWVGRLGGDLEALAARLREQPWSPARLEQLGACGFKFFAARVLGLEAEVEAEVELGPLERGTLFHAVLADFFARHPQLPADREAARALAREFLAGVRAGAAPAIPPKDPAFLALGWARLEAALDELVIEEHEEQASLARAGIAVERRLEQDFTAALPARDDEAPLRIAGKPDRLEIHRRGGTVLRVRVLDYKATHDRRRFTPLLDPERGLGRTAFQVPVYLLGAALEGLAGVSETTRLEGGFLLLLAPRGRKRVSAELSPALLGLGPAPDAASVAERIRRLAAAAAAGRFDVHPTLCEPWCPYRGVCRYQPPPLEEEAGDA